MSMLEVIEVLSDSPGGFDAAASSAATRAAEPVLNMKSNDVGDMNAEVFDGMIGNDRINPKISCLPDGQSAT
jgi:flavin-binding protein dodecin